jgi:hypothetical protein
MGGVIGAAPPAALAVPPAEPGICPVAVRAVLPLTSRTPAATYAAILSSPEGPGSATGVLWVNTPDGAFRVPFANRNVTVAPFTVALDPIVFTLPKAEPLDNVFLSDLGDPAPAPCQIGAPWVPGISTHLRPDVRDRFRRAIPARPVPIAAQPIADPDAACQSGDAPARTVMVVPPRMEFGGSEGKIVMLLRLAADSSVVDARIEQSDAQRRNMDALESARESVFATETAVCRPRASEFRYTVEITPPLNDADRSNADP